MGRKFPVRNSRKFVYTFGSSGKCCSITQEISGIQIGVFGPFESPISRKRELGRLCSGMLKSRN